MLVIASLLVMGARSMNFEHSLRDCVANVKCCKTQDQDPISHLAMVTASGGSESQKTVVSSKGKVAGLGLPEPNVTRWPQLLLRREP